MSDVNILISVQDAASNQIKNVEKNLDSLGKKSLNVSNLMRTDQENANRFYSKLDGDRLKENINLQKQIQKAAQASAKAQVQAAKEAERAQRQQLSAVKDLMYSMQNMGNFFTKLLKTIAGGSLFGGFLGFKGYEFAKESAQAEQIRLSFQRTFGTGAGAILTNVRNSVHGIIDDMTLMRQSIKSNIEGVSPDRLAQIFKLGAVASQRLGKTSEEGIELARKAIVEFDESALTELGILNKRDASYKTYLAVLDKSTKGLGQYAKIQFQTNYVIDQMSKRFGKNWDVMNDNLQGFQLLESAANNLKRAIGGLLNTAFGPMARQLGTWLSGLYELLSNFDVKSGKSKISLGLANIMGPGGVETLREMAAGVLSLIDGIKGFAKGIASVFRPIIEFVAKFMDIADKSGFNWEKIGKAIGMATTAAFLILTPLGIMAALVSTMSIGFLSIYTTIKTLQGLRGANLLGSILGQATEGVGGAAAGGAAVQSAGASGGLGLGLGAGFWALPALAAGAATYLNTESAVDAINKKAGYSGGSDLSLFTPPSFTPPPMVGANDKADNADVERLLAQAVVQLRSIDSRLVKSSNFTPPREH